MSRELHNAQRREHVVGDSSDPHANVCSCKETTPRRAYGKFPVGEPRNTARHVLRDRYRAGVRRRGAGEAREVEPVTGRRTLRWRAEEDLVFEAAAETLHRPGCERLAGVQDAEAVPAGTVLERVTAPRMCACRPDVTLMLGPG